MRIHYLQHVPFENLGFINDWADENECTTTKTAVFNGEAFPTLDHIDVLIVLGGPMSVCNETDFPWMKEEKEFIHSAIKANIKVIGICMGAQLIASLLGARVYKSPSEEIGWHTIKLKKEHWPFLTGSKEFLAMQWHSDTFDLPQGTLLLAESEACPHQAFLYQKHVLCLQFHLEFTRDIVRMVAENEGELSSGPYIQDPAFILSQDQYFEESKKVLSGLLNRFLLVNSRPFS
ncbi:type 1 glutamine amidotransferase [Rossellomorea aquimaris]|uniref:type 1 glutamine amidotransferase n=1 Tax=Rossellomorea aquimaris TaxID=189382 RepID=UPI0007D08127|nr:type 1 glutamine amidotransferase [Rossellomorea aquimaris]